LLQADGKLLRHRPKRQTALEIVGHVAMEHSGTTSRNLRLIWDNHLGSRAPKRGPDVKTTPVYRACQAHTTKYCVPMFSKLYNQLRTQTCFEKRNRALVLFLGSVGFTSPRPPATRKQ